MRFLHGLGQAQTAPVPPEYYEEPAEVVFNQTAMAIGAAFIDLVQLFDGDSDFYWAALKGNSTGTYSIRFKLPSGRYMSNAQVNNVNAVGTAALPVPIFPVVRIPASGQVIIDITNTSGALNTVQLVFVGIKRFRTR